MDNLEIDSPLRARIEEKAFEMLEARNEPHTVG